MIEHFQLKLADSRILAPSVRHFAFERADGTPFAFTPGQFIQVHFSYDDGKPTKRSYSVGTPADGSGMVERLELAVSYVDGGAATRLFQNLEPGGSIEASGPYGRFCLMEGDANRRYLLIATGTGITPYRAMLPTIEKLLNARDCRFALLYGARNEQDLLYGEEFEAFAHRHPQFAFHPCLSRAGRATPRPN
ncbi:MAG: ferredoxin--NADP reductase, partial [Rhodanobacteraceae bacterium]